MIRSMILLLSFNAVILSAGSAAPQTSLTNITPEEAGRLISREGKWVLKEVDFRQVDADCAGKIWMRFFADHKMTIQRCSRGQLYKRDDLHWEVSSDENGLYVKFENEQSELLLKDEGNKTKSDLHMRLRVPDQTQPKGGINLIHDYQLVMDDKK